MPQGQWQHRKVSFTHLASSFLAPPWALFLRLNLLHTNPQELAHAQWPAVPGRSKDYISKPKPNGYQSLHSTLSMQALQQLMANSSSSSSGTSVVLSYLELQVRTAAMHAAAEGGDAAHAGYKGRLERRQVRGKGGRCCCCCWWCGQPA